MKRKIGILIAVAVSVVVFINLSIDKNKENKFSFSLANIEALASDEGSGSQWLSCYETISSNGTGNQTHVTYCGDCSAKLARSWSSQSSCSK